MLAPTLQPNRINGSESVPIKRSWKLTRSIWIGFFIGSLPINSFVFCLALLIVAFVETRLVIVVIAATIAFYTHGYTDPLIHQAGNLVLQHRSVQPYLQHASSIPILRHLEWYNTAICGYMVIFLAGLPILGCTKLITKVAVAKLVGSKERKQIQVPSKVSERAEGSTSSVAVAEELLPEPVFQSSESELVDQVAERVSEAVQIAKNALHQTNTVPIEYTVSHMPFPSAETSKSAKKETAAKLSKKDKRRGKSKKDDVEQSEASAPLVNAGAISETQAFDAKKVFLHDVHQSKNLSVTNPNASENTLLTGQQVLLHDRIWQDDTLSDGVIENSSIEACIDEQASSLISKTQSDRLKVTSLNGYEDTSTDTIVAKSQWKKRKKLTVKETIIDIIRWKKPDSTNGSNSMSTQSSLSATKTSVPNVAISVAGESQASASKTGRANADLESQSDSRQKSSSQISAISSSLTSEPLQFLLGYLSNSKRGMDRGGGK